MTGPLRGREIKSTPGGRSTANRVNLKKNADRSRVTFSVTFKAGFSFLFFFVLKITPIGSRCRQGGEKKKRRKKNVEAGFEKRKIYIGTTECPPRHRLLFYSGAPLKLRGGTALEAERKEKKKT